MAENIPLIVRNDEWLSPFSNVIENRIEESEKKEKELVGNGNLADFATGYLYFGLHGYVGYVLFISFKKYYFSLKIGYWVR